MGAQATLILWVLYFVLLGAIVQALGSARLLDETINIEANSPGKLYNDSLNFDAPPSSATYSSKGFLGNLWDFAINWDVDLDMGAFIWVVRLFFVYIPLLLFSISIYFSLPFVSD